MDDIKEETGRKAVLVLLVLVPVMVLLSTTVFSLSDGAAEMEAVAAVVVAGRAEGSGGMNGLVILRPIVLAVWYY